MKGTSGYQLKLCYTSTLVTESTDEDCVHFVDFMKPSPEAQRLHHYSTSLLFATETTVTTHRNLDPNLCHIF